MGKKESSYSRRKKEVAFWKKKAQELKFDVRSLERILEHYREYENRFVDICQKLADRNLSTEELEAVLSGNYKAIGLVEALMPDLGGMERGYFEEVVDMEMGSVFGNKKKTTND